MTLFHDMNLSAPLLKALDALKFTQPTPIQAQTIPHSLEGKDILGSAQTGTGKTLAFSIPLIDHLLKNPKGMVLILTPTRELAQQVATTIKQLTNQNLPFKTALLIGGEAIGKQFHQLRANPRVIVGTPGRVIDHLERRTLRKSEFSFLVLDETDRMFDMGFGIQLEEIVSQLPENRQTLMFSATFPPKIEKLAVTYMKDPIRFFADEVISISDNLVQEAVHVKESDKYHTLVNELNTREGSVIVFVKTKINADRLATQLMKENHNASAIHGDLRQHKRERVMAAFRQGRYRIMVATDIAARGLDVPHVQHVINYDLPQASEDFIHRIGRTARNGASGSAITFISTRDRKLWDDIQRLMNPDMPRSSHKGGSSERGTSNRNKSRFAKGSSAGRSSADKKFSDRPFSKSERGPFKKTKSEDRQSGSHRFDDKPSWKASNRSSDKPQGKTKNHQLDNDAWKKTRTDQFSDAPWDRSGYDRSNDKPWWKTNADQFMQKPRGKNDSRSSGKPWEKTSDNRSSNKGRGKPAGSHFDSKSPWKSEKKSGDQTFSRRKKAQGAR